MSRLVLTVLAAVFLTGPLVAQDPAPGAGARDALGADLCDRLGAATALEILFRSVDGDTVLADRTFQLEGEANPEGLRRILGDAYADASFERPSAEGGLDPLVALRFRTPEGPVTLLGSAFPAAILWVEGGRRVALDPGGPLAALCDLAPGLDRRTTGLVRRASRVTVFRTLPEPGEIEGLPSFVEHPVIDARVLEGAAMEPILRALLDPATWGTTVADCFEPRHGLRIEAGDDSFDVLLCFECNQGRIGDRILGFDRFEPLRDALEAALGPVRLTPELLATLSHRDGDHLEVPPIAALDEATARAVAAMASSLVFDSIGRLDLEAARILGESGGESIELRGVGEWEGGAAWALARFPGELDLTAIRSLPVEAARGLSSHLGQLRVDERVLRDAKVVPWLARANHGGLEIDRDPETPYPDVYDFEVVDRYLLASLESDPPEWVSTARHALRAATIDPANVPHEDWTTVFAALSGVPFVLLDDRHEILPETIVFQGTNVEAALQSLGEQGVPWRWSHGGIVVGEEVHRFPFDAPEPPPATLEGLAVIARRLETVVPVDVDRVDLADFAFYLGDTCGVPIRLDRSVAADWPVEETRVRLHLPRTTVARALSLACGTRLRWRIETDGVVIETR